MSANGAGAGSGVGEFTGAGGTIRIDPARLTIAIDGVTHALSDCSTTELHCFKNEALGFHVVFPRSCARPIRFPGETEGGARFFEFASVPHGDVRSGRYASELSDRFSYRYYVERGLFEIQYDPTGRARFGPEHTVNDGYGAWLPYTYGLAEGAAFLRCRR
jgi:hypothetical protein